MNIVLCIAIYLSVPVDYNRYHTCNQESYQPAIPNQVCVCRTTSAHSQAKSIKQCVRRRICEVSYKTVQTFSPNISCYTVPGILFFSFCAVTIPTNIS